QQSDSGQLQLSGVAEAGQER
ncbi:hypothetical protein E3A20_27880, partial [Planctomyces bekefii]